MRRLLLIILILFGVASNAYSQKRVTGQVLFGEDNSPAIGATVVVNGHAGIGAVTDNNGNFSFQAPDTAREISVSYLGMETSVVPISTGVMRIVLQSDAQSIETVVVTGMTKIDKRLFTGATDQLSADHIRIGGMADISRSLEGRSAGVSVQNVSGTFGTAPKITVRGATSIYGNSKPLWVVDGIIMDDIIEVSADQLSSGDAVTLISSAIAGLNAEDIESFQILKDGSATSIYGARAMAGVIVITTKKGRTGRASISYTGEFTMRLIPSYRNFNLMNSQEQMGVYQELRNKGWLGLAETARAAESGVYGKMYQLINTFDPVTGQFGIEHTPEGMNAYLRKAEYRNTDWFDELFSNSIMHSHSVSMSLGTEKATTYSSISVMNDPGWYKQSETTRYTGNFNSTYNIYKNLSLNTIVNAAYRKQKAPGTLSQDVDVVNGAVKRDFDINPYSYALNSSRALDPAEYYTSNYAPFNIMNELDNNYINLAITDLKFQSELKWSIIKDLDVSLLGAAKYKKSSQEHNITDDANQSLAYRAMDDSTIRERNPLLYSDPGNPLALPISVLPKGGIYHRTDNDMFSYDLRAAVNWNKVFGNDHIVNIYGAAEINSVDRHQSYFLGWGNQYKSSTPFYVTEFFKRSIEQNSDYYSITDFRNRNAAFAGLASYSYKGKYTVSGTYRYEGSNRLGKARESRWLPTWNVSGRWNVHEENFFRTLRKAVSHFAIRASYSLTADNPPGSVTNSLAVINSLKPYRSSTDTQENGLWIVDPQNSELTYEKKHELNIGASLGFLNNRINLDFDWYTRNNYDLIGVATTGGMSGNILKMANVADMHSSGVEFTLSTRNIVGRDFRWTTDLTFSYATNEVTQLQSQSRVIDLISNVGSAMEGYSQKGLYSYRFNGLNNKGIPTFVDAAGEAISSEDLNFQARENILNIIKYEGPSLPTITGGFGNIFTYKNFRLNAFITYSFGNKVRLDPVFSSRYNDLTAMPREFADRWIMAGDEHHTSVPVILNRRQAADSDLGRVYNAYNFSDARIADGGFIRMKEISLTYDFPDKLIDGWAQSFSVRIQATNPFLIYSDKKLNGQDPEFFRSGGVSAPVPQQFTMTIRIGF